MRVLEFYITAVLLIVLWEGAVGVRPERDDPGRGGDDVSRDQQCDTTDCPECLDGKRCTAIPKCRTQGFCRQICTNVIPCPNRLVCKGGVCTVQCTADNDCTAGLVCSKKGLCTTRKGRPECPTFTCPRVRERDNL